MASLWNWDHSPSTKAFHTLNPFSLWEVCPKELLQFFGIIGALNEGWKTNFRKAKGVLHTRDNEAWSIIKGTAWGYSPIYLLRFYFSYASFILIGRQLGKLEEVDYGIGKVGNDQNHFFSFKVNSFYFLPSNAHVRGISKGISHDRELDTSMSRSSWKI